MRKIVQVIEMLAKATSRRSLARGRGSFADEPLFKEEARISIALITSAPLRGEQLVATEERIRDQFRGILQVAN